MATYKSKIGGSFLTATTRIKTPVSEVMLMRTANSGTTRTENPDGKSLWFPLRERSFEFYTPISSGGPSSDTNSRAQTNVDCDGWVRLVIAFTEFDLSGINLANVTSAKLRYTLTGKNTSTKVYAYEHNYGILSSSVWKVVDSSTPSLGFYTVNQNHLFTRDISFSPSVLSGNTFQIATIPELFFATDVSPSGCGQSSFNGPGSPSLILSGDFDSEFRNVTNIGVQ